MLTAAGCRQLDVRPIAGQGLGRIEDREVLADDLAGPILLQPLRASWNAGAERLFVKRELKVLEVLLDDSPG